MKKCLKRSFLFICIAIASCSKSNSKTSKIAIPKPVDIIGNWTIVQFLGNDYYGGPIHWKNDNGSTKIKFTSEGKYYRKNFNQDMLLLEGSFTKVFDSSILVVPKNPLNYNPNNPASSNYILTYSLQTGGYLILGDFGTEGLIKEKYLLDK